MYAADLQMVIVVSILFFRASLLDMDAHIRLLLNETPCWGVSFSKSMM